MLIWSGERISLEGKRWMDGVEGRTNWRLNWKDMVSRRFDKRGGGGEREVSDWSSVVFRWDEALFTVWALSTYLELLLLLEI